MLLILSSVYGVIDCACIVRSACGMSGMYTLCVGCTVCTLCPDCVVYGVCVICVRWSIWSVTHGWWISSIPLFNSLRGPEFTVRCGC